MFIPILPFSTRFWKKTKEKQAYWAITDRLILDGFYWAARRGASGGLIAQTHRTHRRSEQVTTCSAVTTRCLPVRRRDLFFVFWL